ncbi:hypothetical protein V6N11_058719 [Hibiscus sabdariffa]|uniref:RNase H type-1 domain-containing protein n=1 Tax=Hibiscus sabdariffa TaxID=183260 RepID=A0ABR2U5S0_9ROSI
MFVMIRSKFKGYAKDPANLAETLTVRVELVHAAELGLVNLIVELDNEGLIKRISSGCQLVWDYDAVEIDTCTSCLVF